MSARRSGGVSPAGGRGVELDVAFAGPSSGRWVRRGSTLIVLGVERPVPASLRGELLEEVLLETGQPTLRRGSSGQAVRELQQRLKQRGFDPGPLDGQFGSLTDSAVRAFQRAQGLGVDGIVGPNTWGRLLSGTPSAPVAPGPAPVAPGPPAERWVLPADVRAAGDAQHVPYEDAPPWSNGAHCTGRFTPGADELGRYVRATFPGVTSVGGYSCRQNTATPSQTSVHGTGRAIDIMIPPIGNRANSAVGDPIAHWLVRNAAAIGVQYIIWNRTAWGAARSRPKDRPYTGPNPHIDHLHVEVTSAGGARLTPWFTARS